MPLSLPLPVVDKLCTVVAQVGPTYAANRGFGGVVRNGAGDYTLTMLEALPANATLTGGVLGSTGGIQAMEPLAGNTLRVRITDAAGAALEASFSVVIHSTQ